MSKNSKRLLYFVSEDWYFCTHRLPLAQAALAQGYEVFLATSLSTCQQEIESAGIKVIPLHAFNRSSSHLLQEIHALRELKSIYTQVKPDIVHHVAMKPVIYGSIVAWVTQIPQVINAFGGLGYLFTNEGLKVRLKRKIVQSLLRLLLNRSKSILILQNTDDKKLLLEQDVIKKEHLVLIRGAGVNTDTFSYQEEPTIDQEKGPIVAFVSRMLKDKGILELIEAIKILKARHVKAQFLFCGDIDLKNPSSVSSQILEEWNKQVLITWVGHQKETAPVYHQSHVVALPSYREGLPKTLLEALSCGRSVVTTDVPGCREVVEHGKNGLLVPPRDSKALADALHILIESPVLRKKMGKQGRKMIVQNFSQQEIINQTLKLYNP